jgi:hypothetical protein
MASSIGWAIAAITWMIAVFYLTRFLTRSVKRMPLGVRLTFYVGMPAFIYFAYWLGINLLPPHFQTVVHFGAILGGTSAAFAAIAAFVRD